MPTSDPPTAYDTEPIEEMLCPHCLKPVDPISHFCHECGGLKNAHSAIDPVGQVYSAGHAHSTTTARPMKLIVALGIWLLFLPQMFVLIIKIVLVAMSLGDNEYYGTNRQILLIFCLTITALYCLILYKTTWAYTLARRRANGLCLKCKYDLRGSMGQPTCPECGCEIEWFEDDSEEILQET